MLKSIALFAALATAAAALPAAAQQAPQAPAMHVSFADLNLARPADTRLLQARIDHAVAEVCGRPTVGSSDEEQYQRCRTDTLTALRPNIAQAMAHADAGTQLAAR